VFLSEGSYAGSGYGVAWVNFILDQYNIENWILMADADECLVWPRYEGSTIKDLTRRLDAGGAEGLFTLLLDMYSEKPFGSIHYVQGENFLKYAAFYDRAPYRLIACSRFPHREIYGGVRDRVTETVGDDSSPCISKVPLVRWRKEQRFVISAHSIKIPLRLAPMRGALLHFKFLDDIYGKCVLGGKTGEHIHAREFRALGAAMVKTHFGSFFQLGTSVRYTDSIGLLASGILNETDPFGSSLIQPA
jgi:hypothetical protein